MKKTILMLLSTTLLAACSSGVDERTPVPKEAGVTHVCINEKNTRLHYSSQEMVQLIQNSLQKKGITSEVFSKTANCTNLLRYAFKGRKELIVRGSISLTSLVGERKLIGEVGYYRRGDERDLSNQSGLQGQIDKMINELFKNY